MDETRRERNAWREWAGALEQAASLEALEALAGDLPARDGELRAVLAPRPAGGARKGEGAGAGGVLRRTSAEGYTILVGRSGEENERVTFRLGRGRDWWFHAQGIPGSHVLVQNPRGGDLPPRTLREAAWLAAWYSQGRERGSVEVDYTQRKHVRKVKGGPPGRVTITQNRSLPVRPGDEGLREVLARVDETAR